MGAITRDLKLIDAIALIAPILTRTLGMVISISDIHVENKNE